MRSTRTQSRPPEAVGGQGPFLKGHDTRLLSRCDSPGATTLVATTPGDLHRGRRSARAVPVHRGPTSMTTNVRPSPTASLVVLTARVDPPGRIPEIPSCRRPQRMTTRKATPRAEPHTWEFKAHFRRNAFGSRSRRSRASDAHTRGARSCRAAADLRRGGRLARAPLARAGLRLPDHQRRCLGGISRDPRRC